MKRSPRTIGFIQAAGLAAYIALFATAVNLARILAEANAVAVHPMAGVALFLLAFVTSALICSSIALAYPAYLFFNGRRSEALKVIAWSAAWLISVFAIAAAIVLALGLVKS